MTTHTDEQLKKALAKMLPEHPEIVHGGEDPMCNILDTELLHLCSLVERSFINDIAARNTYMSHLIDDNSPSTTGYFTATSSWQQRTIAAAKVKGVEIV